MVLYLVDPDTFFCFQRNGFTGIRHAGQISCGWRFQLFVFLHRWNDDPQFSHLFQRAKPSRYMMAINTVFKSSL